MKAYTKPSFKSFSPMHQRLLYAKHTFMFKNIRPFQGPLWTSANMLNIYHLLNSGPAGKFNCISEPSKHDKGLTL